MTTFKAMVQKPRKDGLYYAYIRVTHNRQSLYMRTDKMVSRKGVDSNSGIKDPFVLRFCNQKIIQYNEMLNRIATSDWTVHQVVDFLKTGTQGISFSEYARKHRDKMVQDGHARTARNYELAYQHLERFAGTTNVMFSHLTPTFLTRWIDSLSSTARAKEMYPVNVRQIYRQALIDYNDPDAGIIRITCDPWPKVRIPKSDTPQKRAVTMEDCRAFFYAQLPESDHKTPLSELGRDVAMMVLCLAGMNTVDIYFAEKKNFHDGIIGYERRKTRNLRSDRAWFEIRVPDILTPVIDKYLDKTDSPYLFDFHKRHSSYDSFNANVNIGIRQVCMESMGLAKEDSYSCYTFRHTWATVAQNECGASLGDVDFGLNHAHGTRLARVYVKINFQPAWKLNEKVIEKIFFTDEKTSVKVSEDDTDDGVFRVNARQLTKGTMFFRGRPVVSVEDIGFNNVDDVIRHLMKDVPGDIPPRSMVMIRIENKDKGRKQDYSRMI